MNSPLKYKLALVTGASSGLGKELARQLSLKGIPLFLTGRNRDHLEELAKTLAVPTLILPLDLTQRADRDQLAATIEEYVPDLIINNAGFGLYGNALSHPVQEQIEMITLNSEAVAEISLVSAKRLIRAERKGTIMNISSAAAFIPYPSFCLYAASKAFVNHFSESFDQEIAPFGVRCLTVCPGQIDTPFRNRASHGQFTKQTTWTMSCEKAARLILLQVDKGKTLAIIDWPYQLASILLRLLPKAWIFKVLKKKIDQRANKHCVYYPPKKNPK